MNKKGQMTIYIIIGIVLFVVIIVLAILIMNLRGPSVPQELSPVYELYLSCIEQDVENGLVVLGTQGGRINPGEYSPGSDFAPFSSHLNFLGIPVPYWFYISGNNQPIEQVPTRKDMEEELENYLQESVNDCDFGPLYARGYYIDLPENEDVNVDVKIRDTKVEVTVNSDVVSSLGDVRGRKEDHKVVVNSQMGNFHDQALDIYQKQMNELFLEDYSIDVMRLYAPVDGVEIQCSPEIWITRDVVSDLQTGLEANIAALKLKGDYYELNNESDEYFVVDQEVENPVQFIYSRNWTSRFEVLPATEELMIAEPVGNQEGLGLMGFCYVPYHFVYDMIFPVVVQISDGFEVFQFPVAVIIDNNLPRETVFTGLQSIVDTEEDACNFRTVNATIITYSGLNAADADVYYKCINYECYLGETKQIKSFESVLDAELPTCFNGELIARAEGYADATVPFSSNSDDYEEIPMKKEYDVNVSLSINNIDISDETNAIVHFKGQDGITETVVWPEKKEIILTDGFYNVTAYVYGSSQLTIPGTTKVECFDAPRGGISGIFGATDEECVHINVPGTTLEHALIGGGKANWVSIEEEGLLDYGSVSVNMEDLDPITSIEQLSKNYEEFDSLTLQVQVQ